MKKNYLTPTSEIIFSINDELMVVVSGATGSLSDGTNIGDGGEDDENAAPSVKEHGKREVYGDLW